MWLLNRNILQFIKSSFFKINIKKSGSVCFLLLRHRPMKSVKYKCHLLEKTTLFTQRSASYWRPVLYVDLPSSIETSWIYSQAQPVDVETFKYIYSSFTSIPLLIEWLIASRRWTILRQLSLLTLQLTGQYNLNY